MRHYKLPPISKETLYWYVGLLGFLAAAAVLYAPYAH